LNLQPLNPTQTNLCLVRHQDFGNYVFYRQGLASWSKASVHACLSYDADQIQVTESS